MHERLFQALDVKETNILKQVMCLTNNNYVNATRYQLNLPTNSFKGGFTGGAPAISVLSSLH